MSHVVRCRTIFRCTEIRAHEDSAPHGPIPALQGLSMVNGAFTSNTIRRSVCKCPAMACIKRNLIPTSSLVPWSVSLNSFHYHIGSQELLSDHCKMSVSEGFFSEVYHLVPRNLLFAALLLLVLYLVGNATYQLYFSPLSKFPGPKLAAVTLWYEIYYEVFKWGKYYLEIRKMHERYGMSIERLPNHGTPFETR